MRTWLSFALLAPACTEDVPVPIGNVKEGQPCGRTSECEAGFECLDEACAAIEQPDVTGRAGTACMTDGACAAGLCCGNQRVCREPAGAGCGLPEGSRCGLSADCEVGLACDGSGTCARPGSGSGEGDEGDPCGEISDCRRPLICGADDRCQAPPFFPGIGCTRSEEELGAFRAYFEVPRGAPLAEFYRQPFPSDVRLVNGKIDLSGHPDPGNVGGVDFTAQYIRAIEEDYDGFGLTQPVFFQFTDPLDESTLTIDGPGATIQLIRLPGGERVPIQIQYEREKGQFICASSLAVAPVDGFVLAPRTTYAVLITTRVKSFDGQTPIQDGDFAAILSEATPDDPFLAAAQSAFAPIASRADRAEIAVASVYTTGDPGASAGHVRAAVGGAPAAVLSDAVRCTGAAVSPCAEGQARTCPAESNAFHQIHAKVTSPILQRGTRPYLTAGDGTEGALARAANGAVMVTGSEEICVAIAIPKAAMPAGGWPILIYGHGTGGDFLSGMGQVATDMAAEGIAVITFDGMMHGPRQGLPAAARQDPGKLFFNAQNPRAARDNVLQGAADIHNLVRLVEALELTDAAVGVAARFDPGAVLYFGHSQGTVVGAPFFTTNERLAAAVFSGAGAEIGLTMVHKRKPNDVASLTRAIFGDQTISRLHPMIGLMSLFFGPSDATPFAPSLAAGQVHFLHVYGRNDGFTPDVTQKALARAGGYPIVGQVIEPIDGVSQVASPASRNLGGASVGAIQFEPPLAGGELEYDGHFVGSRDPAARAAIRAFLGTAARTGVAEIRR
jgi:predicted esterase